MTEASDQSALSEGAPIRNSSEDVDVAAGAADDREAQPDESVLTGNQPKTEPTPDELGGTAGPGGAG
jgi:hypothetical protein